MLCIICNLVCARLYCFFFSFLFVCNSLLFDIFCVRALDRLSWDFSVETFNFVCSIEAAVRSQL